MKKLTLLPGLDGTGLLFQPLLDALGDSVRVQVIRYPLDQYLTVPELAMLVRQQVAFDSETVLLAYRLRLIAEATPSLAEKPWNIPCHYLQASGGWVTDVAQD